jgi:signal transduction histidine kinase
MRIKTILVIMAMLAIFASITGGYFYYHSLKKSSIELEKRRVSSQAMFIKGRLSSYLMQNIRVAGTLAGISQVRQYFRNPNIQSLASVNDILDHFQQSLDVNVCYLMNHLGITIASSNRMAPDSFVGHNYGFRPYFRQAMEGNPTIYMALGITSGLRGIYYSHPVRNFSQSETIGAVVIKASVKSIENEICNNAEGIVLVSDPNGIIFMSSRPEWLYHTLWKPGPENIKQLRKTRQFGSGPWEWTGLEIKGTHLAKDKTGGQYVFYHPEMENFPGWSLVYLVELPRLIERAFNPINRSIAYIVEILSGLVVISIIYLYRRGSHELSLKMQAEDEIRENEQWLYQIIQGNSIATMVMDRNHKITHWNTAMEKLTGIFAARLIGKTDQWKAFYDYPRPILADLVLDGADDSEIVAHYGDRIGRSSVVPGAYEGEAYFPNLNGRSQWLFFTAASLKDVKGHPVGCIETVQNVTEAKEAEEALRNSEKQLRFFSSELLIKLEKERKRISRELHDSIGQMLNFTLMNIGNISRNITTDSIEDIRESLDSLKPVIRKTIDEIRRICADLRPAIIDELGLKAAIEYLCETFSDTYTSVNLEHRIRIDEKNIPKTLNITIFRVVQEGLNNIGKHSRADHAFVILEDKNAGVELEIGDNGSGFNESVSASSTQKGSGIGLASMKERTEYAGGQFRIVSTPGKGTVLHAKWSI